MKLGLTLLRVVVGALFFGHGTQKLKGWFGGHGLEGTAGFFESLGLRPGRRHATAAGAAEAGGGALIATGLLTPVGAGAIIGTMATAIRTVHLKNGPWVANGGYEYNLVLIAIMVALADVGPGDISLDHAFGTEIKGPLVALAALAGGIATATVLTRPTDEGPTPSTPGDPASADSSAESTVTTAAV